MSDDKDSAVLPTDQQLKAAATQMRLVLDDGYDDETAWASGLEAAALRQPKALTVTVVSAADGNPMHTFKIDPTKKTIVRPLHSMLGYVFEPEGSHADD